MGQGSGPEFRLDVLGRIPVQFPGGRPSVGGRGRGVEGRGSDVAASSSPARSAERRAPSAEPTSGGMEAGGVADSLLSGACVLFTLGMFSTGL